MISSLIHHILNLIDPYGPKGWASRLRRRALALRAKPLRVLTLRASIPDASDPYGIDAGCQRVKEMRLQGYARPYKRKGRGA